MELKVSLITGEKVEIVTEGGGLCISMVEDTPRADTYIVTMPVCRGKEVIPSPGESLDVAFYRKDSQYCFQAQAGRRFRQDNLLLLELVQVSPVRRRQRRQYFRLNKRVPMAFRAVPAEKTGAGTKWYNGYVVNIGGGGIRFLSPFPPDPGVILECCMDLPGGDEVTIQGKVLRVKEEGNKILPYDVALCFFHIEEGTRERVIRYVFQEQQRLRRNLLTQI